MDQPVQSHPTTNNAPLTPAAQLSDDPVIALTQALQAAGVNTSQMKMTVHDDMVNYLGGYYRDRQLVVELPSGKTGSYSADLVARNPQIAIIDMQRDKLV